MRRLGRFTKAEILEAEARFLDGQSVYKIGREMGRKQRPIKLHLINLGLLDEASLEINYNAKNNYKINIQPNYIDVIILSFLLTFYPFLGLLSSIFYLYIFLKCLQRL